MSSGNRVIADLVYRALRLEYPEEAEGQRGTQRVRIWHGDGAPPPVPDDRAAFCIVPVRDPVVLRASWEAHGYLNDGVDFEKHRSMMAHGRHRFFARMPLMPVRYVSYEALVADPEGVGRSLVVDFLGLPWPGYPASPEKPGVEETGPIFDGNEKYRALRT
jgi:hypothetical protein